MNHCRDLTFEDEPDYNLLSKLLTDLAVKEGLDLTDHVYDWVTKDYE